MVERVDLPEPFRWWGEQIGVDLPGAKVLFTTRRGGVSPGSYSSLNLGTNPEDAMANFEENVRRVEAENGVRLVWGPQIHATDVVMADTSGPRSETADGRATATPGIAPMIRTADCLAIAIAGEGAVAMVHAGWRGLADGVIAAGARMVSELGVGGPKAAAIGPAAGVCCYEVGEEVHARFAAQDIDIRVGRNLDLKAIARWKLEQLGVTAVHDVGLCTICSDPSLFYSHRRDHGVTGRQAGIAWLS